MLKMAHTCLAIDKKVNNLLIPLRTHITHSPSPHEVLEHSDVNFPHKVFDFRRNFQLPAALL